MTHPTATTNDDLQSEFDAIEDNRVEDSLRFTFAGDVERLKSEDGTSVWGWAILGGRVLIPRGLLPVDFSAETVGEGECHREHRQEILDLVRSAYNAGRMAAAAEADADVDQELAAALAKLAAAREAWDANEAKIAKALRGPHA